MVSKSLRTQGATLYSSKRHISVSDCIALNSVTPRVARLGSALRKMYEYVAARVSGGRL